MIDDKKSVKNESVPNRKPLPKRKNNIEKVKISPERKALLIKVNLPTVPVRKALKKRDNSTRVANSPKELILEETIKLPFITTEDIKDETIELPILLTSFDQDSSEKKTQNSVDNKLDSIEPIIDGTVELPLFKENIKSVKQPESKNTIVVENKTTKRQPHFKKYVECTIFIMAIALTLFGAYKIVIWQKENTIIDQEMTRIQNLVEERVVEPVDNRQTETGELANPDETSNPNENQDTPYEQPSATDEPQNNFTEFVNPDIKPEVDDGLSFIDVDITRLQTINTDTNAYIKIDNLDVNYPVVQTTDNSYYLSHSFDKKYTSAGWVFGDYRNNWDNLNDNTIIYGHNRRNYAMFGSLKKMYNRDWYENKSNHLIYISTENKNMIFEIFSVYDIPTETYYLTNNFKSKLEYQNFLNTIKGRSTLKFDTSPTTDDKILTLSTCSGSKNKTVVHAKLIKYQNKTR